MAGQFRVPRRRGALIGGLLILLGTWGGLVAFIGPYFHFAYTPDSAWTYAPGRLWLEILPGVAAVLGGAILLVSRLRLVAIFGAWLAAISGAWFAIGSALAPLWTHGSRPAEGVPVGGTVARAVEQIGFFTGLGVVLAFVAAVAIGRLTVLSVSDVVPADVAADRKPSETAVKVPASRRPVGVALLRRVASGRGASSSAADSKEGTEPANISS